MSSVQFRPMLTRAWVIGTALVLSVSCASAPKPDAETPVVWGYVRIVPKQGTPTALTGGYGDRRLAEVRRVDYSHPRFAVVFSTTSSDLAPEPAEVVIERHRLGHRLSPAFASTSPGAGLRLTNVTDTPQVLSLPSDGRIARVPPGESVVFDRLSVGEATVHLLGTGTDSQRATSQIWITPGLTAVAERSGRYELRGLHPGRHRLRAWHPRLPLSSHHDLDLDAGAVQRLDIEIGVDRRELQEQGGDRP